MASQNDSRNDQGSRSSPGAPSQSDSRKASSNASSNASSSRGTPGNEQAARSEEQLDTEERSLIGNTSEDRNLTGSTTYVTLPDQQGDQAEGQPPRQASGSQRRDTQR